MDAFQTYVDQFRLIEQQRLAAVIDSSDDAILSKTLEGIVTTWNKGAERLYGYRAEDIVGQPLSIIFPPDRKDELFILLSKVRQGKKIEHFESKRMRKNGEIFDASVSISPVHDADGKIIGASAITRDVTARKKYHEYRMRLAAIVECSFDPIWSVGLNGLITSWNGAAEKVFGYSREQALGQKSSMLSPNISVEEGERDQIVNRLKNGERVSLRTPLKCRDGKTVPIELVISPILSSEGLISEIAVVARQAKD